MRKIDDIINDRAEIEQSLKRHKDAMKVLEEKKQEIDGELMKKFEQEGTTSSGTTTANCTVVEESYPRLSDAEVFFDHIRESGDYSLLYKRVGLKAWREYHAMYGNPPGVEESTMKKVTIKLK